MTESEFAQLKNAKVAANSCHRTDVRKDRTTVATPKRGKPNKTETEYGRMLAMEFPMLTDKDIVFEGLTLRMSNGHAYTPDWVLKMPGGWILCVEVKSRGANGYRQPSYQRAKLAFDQCKVEYPFRFRWAEKVKGVWEISK